MTTRPQNKKQSAVASTRSRDSVAHEANQIAWADLSWKPIAGDAKVTTGSRVTPVSKQFDDIYFSGRGIDETQHVFIDGNNIRQRFAQGNSFVIGETGFGTGLNFLAALETWQAASKPVQAHLDYVACEQSPLRPEDIRRTFQHLPNLKANVEALIDLQPPLTPGFHRLPFLDNVTLTLIYGDVRSALAEIEAKVDAWFLDGFSPSRNPDMWCPEVFQQMARLSNRNTTVATFTVAGLVRRGLTDNGFDVKKTPGFGRKREMLVGQFLPQKTALPDESSHFPRERKPWFARSTALKTAPDKEPLRLAIIGGGIAGASLAHAVRRRGGIPTIIDRDGLAAGASGNKGGLIMPRLDIGADAVAYFFRQAYIHCLRTIDNLTLETSHDFFNRCGVKLLASDKDEVKKFEKLLSEKTLPTDWMTQQGNDLFFPQAGVVDPKKYVHALASHTRVTNECVSSVIPGRDNIKPEVMFTSGNTEQFDAVIIANGAGDIFTVLQGIPFTNVDGQLDYFAKASPPEPAIAAGPYAAPAPGGGLLVGATYMKAEQGVAPTVSLEASKTNIEKLREIDLQIAKDLNAEDSAPRAATRRQTPDRLPTVGAIPNWDAYERDYDGLRHGQRKQYTIGRPLRGLYVMSGLGSRGLVTAPLCADILISEIMGAPSPVAQNVRHGLHPARFFIRQLKRQER